MTINRISKSFFQRDVLEVAPDLLGKVIYRKPETRNSPLVTGLITEVEAYRGEEDLACHARFGRTKRTEALYSEAGTIYAYLIYGMYWMFNIVTGQVNQPQAVLIRGVQLIDNASCIMHKQLLCGPGKVGRWLGIDKSYYGEDITTSHRIWIEHSPNHQGLITKDITTTPRIGVDYAGDWAQKPWRYVLVPSD